MLEKIDLSKKVDKKTYRRVMDEAEEKLGLLQRECKDAGIPVILVFEGMGAAGKGVQINRLIQALDPRGFDVYACDRPTEDEQMRPFLWRYWTKTPAKGRIAVFDRSWYRSVQVDRFDGLTREDKLGDAYQDILSFEKQLCDDGTVIMKFFLYIDKDEQKKRFKKLEGSKETSWRVTEEDWNRNKDFDRYLKMNEEMLEKTDTDYAPWVIIEAVDKDYAALKIVSTVMDRLEYELEHRRPEDGKQAQRQESKTRERFKNGVLSGIDLSKSLTEEEYKTRLKKLQKRLAELHSELYRLRIPVVIGFEGWDAGGKGGAIKRLTSNLDPRGYRVNPTAAPNDIEKVHHYLWRFWNSVPKAGHIAILTAPGMDGLWWSGLKDSVRRPSGDGPTRKSTRWNPIWPMPERWFLNSGSTLTRMSRSADSRSVRPILPSSGRLRMRTGATVRNGTSMRKRSTRCSYVLPPPMLRGLWWREMTNDMPG